MFIIDDGQYRLENQEGRVKPALVSLKLQMQHSG